MASIVDRARSLVGRDRTSDQISGLQLGVEFAVGPVQSVEIRDNKLTVAQHNAEEWSRGEGLIYDSVKLKPNQRGALKRRGVREFDSDEHAVN